MNVQPLVHSRAHRILKRMSSYRTIKEQNGTVPLVMRALTFHQGEKVLGIYKNKADECDETLVITTCGIYLLQNNTSQYIRYDEIAHIEAPSKEQKHELDGLVAHLTCGEVMKIPIRGGKGRFRDAWPFLQFLTRVMSDLQKTAKQPIHDLKIDRALTGYGSGGISFGAAAQEVDISKSEFARHAYAKGIEPPFSKETLQKELL